LCCIILLIISYKFVSVSIRGLIYEDSKGVKCIYSCITDAIKDSDSLRRIFFTIDNDDSRLFGYPVGTYSLYKFTTSSNECTLSESSSCGTK